jgi:hypothetical protein
MNSVKRPVYSEGRVMFCGFQFLQVSPYIPPLLLYCFDTTVMEEHCLLGGNAV